MYREVRQYVHVLVVMLLDLLKSKFRPLNFAYAIDPSIDRYIRYWSQVDLIPKIVYIDDR